MKLYYIAYAKMPNEKAHGIHIAKTAEAFALQGIEVVLLVPNRKGDTSALKDYYGLQKDIQMVRLPMVDLGNRGPIRYRISAFSFVLSYVWYLWRNAEWDSVVYTVDLDLFSFLGIPVTRLPYFSEVHGGKKKSFLQRFFLSHISGVIATTTVTKTELMSAFNLPESKTIVEPNGVDIKEEAFLSKKDARAQLGIPPDRKLVLYVGRVLAWKGIDILPKVAEALPDVTVGFLGATREEYEQTLNVPAGKVTFYGSVSHTEVPLWLSASDACLVLGTPRDEYSYRYTSPMKIFEYLASERPLLASKTPAFTSVLSDEECYFFEPDSALAVVEAIQSMYSDSNRSTAMARNGKKRAQEHTWTARAKRILAFMQKVRA